MKKRKVAILAASAALSLAVVAGAGCSNGLFGGSYELKEFVVNTSGVSLTYEVGEDVSFNGLSMIAMFSDATTKNVALSEVKIYLGEEDITSNLSKITETVGKKKVKIVYSTDHGEDSYEFEITVSEEVLEKITLTSFNTPDFISDYKANLNQATNDKTVANFEQVFFKNDGVEYYTVGDDNAFKLLPTAQVFDKEEFSTETLERVTVNSEISVLDGEEYVELTKSAKEGETYVYEYYQGTTLLVTENAANNTFDFADGAIEKVFKLAVLPNETVYEFGDIDAIELEVKIVDAFNVYTAGELAVFDNTDKTEWTALKTANGVANVTTNGVVLHENIKLEAKDIPADFQYTLPDNYNIKYRNAATEKVGSPETFGLTRTFLWNQYDGNPVIYERKLEAGQTFNFYGNYFDLDASGLPLVASFKPEGDFDGDTYYGSDFSNTSLFRVEGNAETVGEQDEHFNFYNLAMKGNAKSDQLVLDKSTTGENVNDDSLIYAGGLILTKVAGVTAQYDNTRMYNFFIALFAESDADTTMTTVNYNRAKVYDSFQDAVYLWGATETKITNSYFKRAGGPLIIMNHVDADSNTTRVPKLEIDDESEMEAYLAGTEIWFKSVNAVSTVENFKELDTGVFKPMRKTIFGGPNGKMNIIALLMRDATSANEALNSISVKGSVSYKGFTLDKMFGESGSSTANLVYGIQTINANTPIFGVGDSVYYTDLTNIINPLAPGENPEEEFKAAALDMATKSATADYLTLYFGGINVFLGYQNYQAPSDQES